MSTALAVALAILSAVPATLLRLGVLTLPVELQTLLFGMAVIGASFAMAWGAEAAERDIPRTLALTAVALLAVLPEYAVDIVFAFKAGQNPAFAPYATANMTGSNRLLLGLGWPLVAVIAWLARRRPRLSLSRDAVMPLFFLGIATIYSFLLPLKAQIGLLDSVLLFALFGVYAVLALREPTIEPDLVGPAATLGALPKTTRRLAILGLFGFASFAIVESAGPFAEGLVRTGQALGIDEFLLVQWLAPLASEAPEFLVAALLSVRGKGSAALALLLSSKLNQWTLLVGSLPLAYVVGAVVDGLPVSSIPMHALPLDGRQAAEIWLTAAQSLFGVAVLASLSLELSEAVLLAVLFSAQLIVGGFLRTSLHNPAAANEELFVFTLGYLILSLIFGIQARKTITSLRRRGRRKHLNYPAVQE